MSDVYFVGTGLDDPQVAELVKEAVATANIPSYAFMGFSSIHYKDSILQEAYKLKPRLIMCFGTSALNTFAVVEDSLAAARSYDGSFEDSLVRATYSPVYLLKRGGSKCKEYLTFVQDIKNAWDAASGANAKVEVVPKLYSLDEFVEFMMEFANEAPGSLALDFEGSSLNPLEKGYRLAGIGLATTHKAGYLWLEDYATVGQVVPETTLNKLKRFMLLINEKCPLVFNANYETLVTANVFNSRLDKADDVMQRLRALAITGGLKDIAAAKLGIRGWTREVDDWLDALKVIVQIFKPTIKSAKAEFKKLQSGGIKEAINLIESKDLKSTADRLRAIKHVLSTSAQWYGEEGAYAALERYINYLNSINDWEVRYNHIPKEIIGRYCGLDCYYTVQLRDRYYPELQSSGLTEAANYYNAQMQFGIEAEMLGFAWDDAYAADLEVQYNKQTLESLRNFLLVDQVREALGINNPVSLVEIKAANDISTLKKFFNPDNNQPENTARLSSILLNSKVKMALMLRHVSDFAQNNSVEDARVRYPSIYKVTERYKSYLETDTTSEYPDYVNRALAAAYEAKTLTPDEIAVIGIYHNYKLESADSGTIEALANACSKYLGVSLDKEETWTDEYKAVFYYKAVKKWNKVVSAFINGKNGRQQVQVVRQDPTKSYAVRVSDYTPELGIDLVGLAALISQYSYAEITAA